MEERITHASTIIETQQAEDRSLKFLWQLFDGQTVESIYFTFQNQVFTCVSSQVGCNVRCPFCATGQQRVLRNLTAQEILAQVIGIGDRVRASQGVWPLDQVALAGMGEPLLNLAAGGQAAAAIRAQDLARVGALSTSGVVPRIWELAEAADHAVNKLFLSLHATTDAQRNILVPLNKKYPLAAVLEAARGYADQTGIQVTATYLLFANFNDSDDDLARLVALLDPDLFIVQLSEWNPVSGVQQPFLPSPRLDFFQTSLMQAGFTTFVQRSKGREIEGGCGPLRSSRLDLVQHLTRGKVLTTSVVNPTRL